MPGIERERWEDTEEKRRERTYLIFDLFFSLFDKLAQDISPKAAKILILEMRGCPPAISGGRTTRTTPPMGPSFSASNSKGLPRSEQPGETDHTQNLDKPKL